ncbi:MAG: tRNA uridine-5-carboxymethylaminomethyl(34) synthesis GTPase MnmE [Mycoplasmataceae bacterium]|jgi:tRNA modification GTPase|nr:tRNA uridine-5-carboxymethylaminomethyl(34) synthesis GTPase MnmE [Mycoplasmataceae bacterium]
MIKNTTIVSLATPPMNGAIHIIRISGDDTYKIINKLTDKNIRKESYIIQHTNIVENKNIIDNVLLMKFVAPKSFTGEDLIEINCHGGIFLANKIISLLIKNGAKLAEKGEFSKRAFMNKKISLNQAHAINNLINSTNEKGIEFAHNGLNDKTNKKLEEFINTLFLLIGQIEVNIDYPEYDDVPAINKKQFIQKLNEINKTLLQLISSSKQHMKYVEGFNIAILGKPNVGKSSLLNVLLQEEKAIVSSTPGTTRDVVEGRININGLTFNIIDTAGIRSKTCNKIEKIGINNAIKNIDKADIILFVIDGNKKIDEEDKKILSLIKNKTYIIVSNKADLKQVKNNLSIISVSAKNKKITSLLNAIKNKARTLNVKSTNTPLLQSSAAIGYIEQAQGKVNESLASVRNGVSFDLIIQGLHDAYEDLLKVLGKNADYEFINEMFKKFCLGK